MKRKWWIAGVAGAVVVALVGAGVVMAQTPTPGASGSSPSFLDRVAQKLGIETPKLQAAITSASNDQIDAEVAAGKITQAQADKLKQAIANGKLPGFAGPLGDHAGRGNGGFRFGIGAGVDMSKLATFLGTSQDQLKTDLQAANATLATVAQAHGKTRDQLKSFITSTAKTQLDQAVTNKKLTQQQADNALSMLANNLDSIIDGHGRGGHGAPGKMMPGGQDMPSTSATPGAGTRFRGRGPSAPIQPSTNAVFSD